MTYLAIVHKDLIAFKRKWSATTISAAVGPVLYLIAFGWGLNGNRAFSEGDYLAFLIPGLIAMNSMSATFGWIANDVNLSRIYTKTFEAALIAPVSMQVFALAKITSGAIRGLYNAIVVLAACAVFGHVPLSPYFCLIVILNCLVFSAIGFIAGLLIDSHEDMAKASSLVITPMGFLCGTFFPLDRLPYPLYAFFQLLPLTQTVNALRAGAAGPNPWLAPLVLAAWFAICLPIAVRLCAKREL